MRRSDEIQLGRSIVHLVNREKGAAVISETPLNSSDLGELSPFLTKHILNGVRDPDARTARFLADAKDAIVHRELGRAFGTKSQFLSASQAFARHLHAVVESDQRVSPGALVVCSYKATSPRLPAEKEFLALLKLDPSEYFQEAIKKDARGRRYVTFRAVDNIMPSARERLQKCAFLRQPSRGPKQSYDLMVVDRQRRTQDRIAAFFVEKFLRAELTADPVDNTKGFWRGAWEGLSSIEEEIGPQKTMAVRKAMEGAIQGNRIDIDDWAERLPVPKRQQQTIVHALEARLEQRVVPIDPEQAERLTRKLKFTGEHGFALSFDSQFEDEIMMDPPKKSIDPRYGDVFTMTLRVKRLKEVS